jgi:hypothetical protein
MIVADAPEILSAEHAAGAPIRVQDRNVIGIYGSRSAWRQKSSRAVMTTAHISEGAEHAEKTLIT